MTKVRGPNRYSLASIGLHWLMLVLIVGAYVAIELRETFPKGSDPREALKTWHYLLGFLVFGLVWLRIAARLIWASPGSDAGEPALQRFAASVVHLGLYLFMIGMPILGWLILSAEGETIRIFAVHIPTIMEENETLAEGFEEAHELVGTIGYWLIGLHAAASLVHHYIFRDRVLVRMLPRTSN